MSELTVRFNLSFGARSVRGLMAAAMILSAVTEVASESVTLTTYYPAPSGVYSQMITTGNTYLARDYTSNGSGVTIGGSGAAPAGGIAFGTANPYLQSSSYIVMPGGLYVQGGTAYFTNQIQTRGGIHNDSGPNLDLYGGTTGNTNLDGNATVTGNLTIQGAGLYNLNGYQMMQGNAGDWLRINQGQSWPNGVAAYGPWSFGTSGVSIGAWNGGIPAGSLNATGTVTVGDATCAEVEYNINGVTTCAAAGFGGASYVAVQSGIISRYIIMPYYTNPVGEQQGGRAPMLCCSCPAGSCPL